MKTEKGANTSSQNASKATTSKRRKKLAAASVAGVAGLSLIGGGTLAAWNDAERAAVDVEAGAFGLEIATSADEDGNLEWLSGTTPGSTATIDLSTFIEDSVGGSAWRPCDMVTTNVFLRASEETTYNGVIEAEAIAEQVNGQFNEDIAYYIGNEHIAINNDGAVGEVDVPADGEPIVLDAQFLFNNTDNESQDRSYEGLWTFNAELADRDYEGAPVLDGDTDYTSHIDQAACLGNHDDSGDPGEFPIEDPDWPSIEEEPLCTTQAYRDAGGRDTLIFEGYWNSTFMVYAFDNGYYEFSSLEELLEVIDQDCLVEALGGEEDPGDSNEVFYNGPDMGEPLAVSYTGETSNTFLVESDDPFSMNFYLSGNHENDFEIVDINTNGSVVFNDDGTVSVEDATVIESVTIAVTSTDLNDWDFSYPVVSITGQFTSDHTFEGSGGNTSAGFTLESVVDGDWHNG